MVRPTESPVVFIQQLGRGLRKYPGKDFVVILDFIGNYKQNYMIPVALSGDNSYNKDNLRRYVATGTQIIPGISTVYFDEVARKEIYRSIDQAKTHIKSFIVSKYRELKNKLGRIPSVGDFQKFGSIDVLNIFNEYGSYHEFLLKEEKRTYKTVYDDKQRQLLKYISQRLAQGKRIHELELLRLSIGMSGVLLQATEKALFERYNVSINQIEMRSALSYLTNQFENPAKREALKDCVFLQTKDNDWEISSSFANSLTDDKFKQDVIDLISLGIENYVKRYQFRYQDTNLVLYEKYTAEDVCRLFNWKEKIVPLNMSGYFYDAETKTFPVFINYEKSVGDIQYDDRFKSPSQLIALSKKNRQINSPDFDHIYRRKLEDKDNKIYLFVRKNKDDPARGKQNQGSNEYYFLGEVHAHGEPKPVQLRDGNNAFEIDYRLDTPVRADIYDYLIGD